MAYYPKSIKDLELYAMEEVKKQVEKTMRKKFYKLMVDTYEKVMTRWYSEYSPSIYPRTYEFLTELPVEIEPVHIGNAIECSIMFDKDKLSHDVWEVETSRFVYMGTHHGSNDIQTQDIYDNVMLEGQHGFVKGTENGTKPYEDTVKELEKSIGLFITELEKALVDNKFVLKG